MAASFVPDHGNWTRTEEFRGPFKRSPAVAAQYAVPIGTDIPFLSIPSPQPERDRAPGEASTIRLWINGQVFNPPEALEPSIEQGKLWGIRGLHRTLQFSLPVGVANEATTSIRVEYQIRVHRTLYRLILYATAALVALAVMIAYRAGDIRWAHFVAAAIRRALYRHQIVRELVAETKLQFSQPVRSVLAGIRVVAIIVLVILTVRWLFLPPVFWDSDSAVLLVWSLSMVPHWQWLAPALTALITQFGFNPSTIAAICLVQLAVYGLCLLVLLKAFRSLWAQIAVMVGVFSQFYMLLIEGSISTEPLGAAGLLLSVAAAVIYAEQMIFEGELDVRSLVSSAFAFAGGMMLAANSRLPLIPLAYALPTTIALYWVGALLTSKRASYHATALVCCGILTVLIISQTWVTNQLVCIFNGSASCVSPYGQAGAEAIAYDLRSADPETRKLAVARLQSATTDPLVKQVFSIAANDAFLPTWILQQNAIAADPKVKDDPVLSARVATPGELDRVMAKATWIFQTRGGEIFWRSTIKRTKEYLDVGAIWRLAAGEYQVPRFARDWLDTSASAVLTFEKTYPALLPIFHDPRAYENKYVELRDNTFIGMIDIIFGPIASELIFVVVCALIVVLSLTNRAFRPAVALCGATVITVGGYSFIMAASETISDRYRMPSSFLLSVLTVCLIGILLDFARRYAFRKPDAISRHTSARTAAAARA